MSIVKRSLASLATAAILSVSMWLLAEQSLAAIPERASSQLEETGAPR